MKRLFRISLAILGVIFVVYLLLPSPSFPEPPSDAVQSFEPADREATGYKRAYFTNYTREEVQEHYRSKFLLPMVGNVLPYKLTYPPEEAYLLIRDQTRSTHLVEFVNPFRDSFFVNEFVAKQAKDDIWYKGVNYEQKITVRLIQSNPYVRVILAVLTTLLIYFFVLELLTSFKDLFVVLRKFSDGMRMWTKM